MRWVSDVSWSFTVADTDPLEAQRLFDNALAENEHHIKLSVSALLSDAASDAVNMVPNGCGLMLSTSGHFNAGGNGNAGFRFSIGKNPRVDT